MRLNEFDVSSPLLNVLFTLPNNKGKILIDKVSLRALYRTTLIYSVELIRFNFKISNDKLENKCCRGSNFDLEIDLVN